MPRPAPAAERPVDWRRVSEERDEWADRIDGAVAELAQPAGRAHARGRISRGQFGDEHTRRRTVLVGW